MRAILVLVASSVFGLACGCPTLQGVHTNRRTTGDVQYQIGDSVLSSEDAVFSNDSFTLTPDEYGAYPGQLGFRLAIGDRAQSGSFIATLIVEGVSLGASEIDLDDERSSLDARLVGATGPNAYHAITGHLSIQEMDLECDEVCLFRASGTLTFSAVGPNGEVFALTSATFVAADESYDTGMCRPSG